jgi:hypothetical protein
MAAVYLVHWSAVPIVINFHRPHNVAVDVDGVADRCVASRVVRDVQRVLHHSVGRWQVSVCANARGRWRLELRGACGQQVWLFASPAAALPVEIVGKLEIFLRESAAVWRPLPSGV